jgi:hypothetical protein
MLAALLAGCSSNSPIEEGPLASIPSAPLNQVANLTLAEGTGIDVPLGIGWGQLRFTSPTEIRLSHIELGFEAPGDQNGTTYVPGTFTALHFMEGGQAQTFFWMGTNKHLSTPHGSNEEADSGQFTSSVPGAVLTVYNNVPGYNLHIGDADDHSGELDWSLGPHPLLVANLPVPREEAGADSGFVRAAYVRHWQQDFPNLVRSVVFATTWSSDFATNPAGARAGVARSSFYMGTVADDQPPTDDYGPDGGTGGYFGSSTWHVAETEGGRDWEVSYWREQMDVGSTETSDGLAVLAMPLDEP